MTRYSEDSSTWTAREYYCPHCRQLRLCLDNERVNCGNCTYYPVIWGEPGELDKKALSLKSTPELERMACES